MTASRNDETSYYDLDMFIKTLETKVENDYRLELQEFYKKLIDQCEQQQKIYAERLWPKNNET